MESTNHINRMRHIIPLSILLVFVALNTSCTFRKGVQAGFGLPVSQQLNPSKTTGIQQPGCYYLEAEAEASSFLHNSDSNLLFGAGSFISTLLPVNHLHTIREPAFAGWPLTLKIKHFILFRQLKAQLRN